jgi:predicted dehydrogenase
MSTTYRVAIIGHTGKGNYGHGLDTVWHELKNCEVVGVADADPKGLAEAVQRLKAPQGYDDYRKMLDETTPDLVAIGPRWLDQHRDMVLAAAEHGAHIYMEKPFCRNLAEADEMVAACEKHDVKLAIAHQTRYSPKLQVIRDLIDDGKIGRVLEYRGRGKEDARGGGEDLWVLGSHVMNLIHHFGGEPQWCFAKVLANGKPITRDDVKPGNEGIGPLAGDSLSATYGLDGAVTAHFDSQRSAGAGGESRFGLRIYGSAGIIEVGTGYLPPAYILQDPTWSPGRSGKRWLPISSAGVDQPEPKGANSLHAGNVAAVQDLIAAIEEDRYPECNIFEARTTIEMIAAVFESHRQGKPVSVPLENRQNPLEQLT